jgi:hypothetical protein
MRTETSGAVHHGVVGLPAIPPALTKEHTMDPNACLTALLDAFRDDDRDAAWQCLEDLHDWLARGGAMPRDPREPSPASVPRRS